MGTSAYAHPPHPPPVMLFTYTPAHREDVRSQPGVPFWLLVAIRKRCCDVMCDVQELVGMRVVMQASGEEMGTVVDIYDGTGAQQLLPRFDQKPTFIRISTRSI